MRFILLSLITIFLNMPNLWASSASDPISTYLTRVFAFQQRMLTANPEASLEQNMKSILVEVTKLAGGAAALESMEPAAFATCKTVAAAYICQQHPERRLDTDTDSPPFLKIWDTIHQLGRPIDFQRLATDYTLLLYPGLADPTPVAAKFAHQFQQQNALNRIKHIAEKRIEYNEYLIGKWNSLPDAESKRQFHYDFSGFSSDRKKTPKSMQDLPRYGHFNF